MRSATKKSDFKNNTYDSIINLIKKHEGKNEYDELVYSEIKTPVYAEVKNIRQTEFYQAQTAGFKPEIEFVIAEYTEYTGEELIEYDGIEYRIIRTAKTNTERELLIICGRIVNNQMGGDSNGDA